MWRAARDKNKRLATLSIDTAIRFRSPADRAAFTRDLSAAVTSLVARYHDESDPVAAPSSGAGRSIRCRRHARTGVAGDRHGARNERMVHSDDRRRTRRRRNHIRLRRRELRRGHLVGNGHRLAHSLFTERDDWDDELESLETGWPGFFESSRWASRRAEWSASAYGADTAVTEQPKWTALAGELLHAQQGRDLIASKLPACADLLILMCAAAVCA